MDFLPRVSIEMRDAKLKEELDSLKQLVHCPSPMVRTNKDIWLVLNYDLKKKMPNFLAPMALGTFAT